MKKTCLIVAVLLLNFWLLTPAEAGQSVNPKEPKKECQLISSGEAANIAKAQSGGKVVSIKLKRDGNKSVYRVRILVGEKRIKNLTVKACR